jgi:hypothetical protein
MLSRKIELTSQLWTYFLSNFTLKILNTFGLQVNFDVHKKVWKKFCSNVKKI